jgi:hypothetical protein
MARKKRLIIFLLLLFFPSILFAEQEKTKSSFKFLLENDFLTLGNQDRWFTSHIRAIYNFDGWSYGVGQEMFTPQNLRLSEPEKGDRPYDGYTYFELGKKIERKKDEYKQLSFRVGAVGDKSKAKRLQKFAHNDLSLGTDPKGWDTQNKSELALEVLYTHGFRSRFDSWLGEAIFDHKYGARLGNVVTDLFLSQDLRRGWFYDGFEFFGHVGLEGRVVAYNTHLDGRLFRDNYYTVNSKPFVATAWAGAGIEYKSYYLGYLWRYQTSEFNEQKARHHFGSVTLGKRW